MPRQGLGMPIVSGASNAPVTVIDDVLWEDFGGSGGEIALNYQETRTNSILHSQDATDAEAWTKANTAIDSTLYEAPDNSTTANAIKSDGTGEQVYKITQTSLSVTAGKTYTLSVHVKKENLGFARIYFSDGAAKKADFNLTTGAVGSTSNTIRTQVDAMDDGWFRCSMTFVATSTISSGQVRFSALAADGDNTPSVAVSGIVLIYVWGFQLEESIEATSYIVTTTEARTATTTLNDTSDVWDFDSANLMPEADPDSEGVWEVPANVVLNGDYEELGSELVTNGTFDADSDWTTTGGWTISGGSANGITDGTLEQVVSFVSGKTYVLNFTVSNYVSGNLSYRIGNYSSIATSFSGNGTYTYYGVASSYGKVSLFNHYSFEGSIDNISVKQVDPNNRWSLGTGWSISDGKASFDASAASTFSYLTQASILAIPLDYELTFTLSDLGGSFSYSNAGIVRNGVVKSFNTLGLSAPGTHTIIVTETSSSNFKFYGHPNSDDFSIDNVTIREYAIQPQDV